jgi:hypothetical protein
MEPCHGRLSWLSLITEEPIACRIAACKVRYPLNVIQLESSGTPELTGPHDIALQATDFCTCVRQGDKDCAAYFVTTMKTTE